MVGGSALPRWLKVVEGSKDPEAAPVDQLCHCRQVIAAMRLAYGKTECINRAKAAS